MGERGTVAGNAGELARRVRAFIEDASRGGGEIADMVGHLGAVGEVAIFGGMPRDLARGGADAFRSDVDLVVDASSEALAELLRDGPAVRNRFGGYRVAGHRHSYDVWALPSTWAIRCGHVEATGLTDLLRTTFFDRDAVLYLCKADRVHHAKRYWSSLRHATVDINLEANPNTAGTIARALRLVLDWEQKAGPRLVEYLSEKSRTSSHLLDHATRDRLQALTTAWARSGECQDAPSRRRGTGYRSRARPDRRQRCVCLSEPLSSDLQPGSPRQAPSRLG